MATFNKKISRANVRTGTLERRTSFREARRYPVHPVILSTICFFLIANHVAGQELEISVSPSPVGSGARAAGMADAFVAIADDATAASWNPAGIIQLELPEMSVAGSYNAVSEEFDVPYHDETSSSNFVDNYDLNYLSVVYPLPFLILNRNAVVSLNYQRKYDFSRDFQFRVNRASVDRRGRVSNGLNLRDFEQEGGLSTITPAFAMELTQKLSLGVSVNLWRSSFISENGWKQRYTASGFDLSRFLTSYYSNTINEEYSDFSGENVVIGALWRINNHWSLGLRYDSAFTGKANYQAQSSSYALTLPSRQMPFPTDASNYLFVQTPWSTREKRSIRLPATWAVGTAWRVNDRLTLSFDVTRTDWNDFFVKGSDGVRHSLVDFSNLDNPALRSHFNPTTTARLGLEYVFIPKDPEERLDWLWTLRGGVFYDEEPASGRRPGLKSGDNGNGKPDPFYGAAAGVGLLLKQRLNIDLAYQARFGFDVNRDFYRSPGSSIDFKENVLQHRVLLSTVIYF